MSRDGTGVIKKGPVILTLLVLSGCASTYGPKLIDGKYYLVGDPICARYKLVPGDQILCSSNDGLTSGYRPAMTAEAAGKIQPHVVRRVQQNNAIQNQQSSNFANAMNQLNQSVQQQNQQNQQFIQGIQQYGTPQVAPVQQNETTTSLCLVNGSLVSCRSTSP